MHFRSLLLLIIQFSYTFSLWTKSTTLDNYLIDVLFSNTLTIIRCNPYEAHILRDLSIEVIGHIKCSNKHLILPENHLENITLLQWNPTMFVCAKKKKQKQKQKQKEKQKIEEEKTIFAIKHKPKNAFKKVKFRLIRMGSVGSSDPKMDDKKHEIIVKYPPRNIETTETENNKNNFTTETYSFRDRPIVCRERQLATENPCENEHLNLTFVCYYRMGVPEPPTIADMEDELDLLADQINMDDDSQVNLYINESPKMRSPLGFPIKIIGIIVIGVIVVVGIVIFCCCCCCGGDDHSKRPRRLNSDTSNFS